MKRWLDIGAIAVSLAAVGFGVTLALSPMISNAWIQPLLAAILVLSGASALIAQRLRTSRKENR